LTTQVDVRRLAVRLPDVVEASDDFGFSAMKDTKLRGFAWAWRERLDPKKPKVPNHEVLVVRVANRDTKEMLLASDPEKFFTEPHYNGFPAVLVRLGAVDIRELEELLTEAWICMAPRTLVKVLNEKLGT
jgi:hypothetical protein